MSKKKLKLSKDIYYGYVNYDYEYFKPYPPKHRLRKKNRFYWKADLNDSKYIINISKLKRKRIKRKGRKL